MNARDDSSPHAVMPAIAHPAGLREIADDYDGYVMDLWGVLHDGVNAFPEAVDCLRQLKARGCAIAILSNAPRRAETVRRRNTELGIDPALSDTVVSSGEDTWRHLKARDDAFYAGLGAKVLHLGPARDRDLLQGNGLEPVASLEAADFILNTGPGAPEARVEDFQALLDEALSLDRPMVCANPDLLVIRGGRAEICAGAIAERYREMGGVVRFHGKPDPGVYERCFAAMDAVPKSRILAVGDSLRTDMAGARAAGIDGLFISGGIHADELGAGPGERPSAARVDEACRAAGVRPVGVMPALVW
ncbi:MAG: TIGR01459 family HAD-type hydrolase [Rhodovibrionaceae bacterium]|nr:TIGR01459 family HAD-type hydrolase [Rhodovibrionaceae bacterium]